MRPFLFLLFTTVGFADTPAISVLHGFSLSADARTFPEGSQPGPMIQASDGNFYGVNQSNGDDAAHCQAHGCGGTIFQITPAGDFKVLYTFEWGNASTPYANGAHPLGLVEGQDGFLYGTTFAGGAATTNAVNSGYGTVFRISTGGDFKSLHKFCFGSSCGEEGYRPQGTLVLGPDGKFYGVTISSGPNHAAFKGTIFRVSTAGAVETLHNFDGFNDGGAPVAGLVRASDGSFYGTTSGGGGSQFSFGTVYRITTAGDYSVLYTFQLQAPNPLKDGQAPKQALVQACHGKLYGVTSNGGLNGAGTIFQIGLDGQYKTLLDFERVQSFGPNALLLATDKNLWGSGQVGNGVYTVTTAGAVLQTIPYIKECGLNGPQAPLVQGKDGKLYGTFPVCGILNGNANAAGSVFNIDAGLPAPQIPTIAAVTNGASFVSGSIVPGEIATLFGSTLTSATGINLASGLPLGTHLLDVDVYVNEIPAPIFAVDDVNGQQQINFQVPWEVAGHSTANIRVEKDCHTSLRTVVPVLEAQPGIISYNVGGVNYGAILHADFSLADSAHPAKAGETVLIYCTGLGAVLSHPQNGAAANGEMTATLAAATVGGVSAAVAFSGLAPGFVGLNQVNLVVPAGLKAGNQPVVLSINGVEGNTVQLPVR